MTRPQKRGKPISRMSVKMRRRADRYRTLRRAVYVRCDGKCERCGRALDPVVWECHHRLRRSQGGPDTLANCVALCSTCHDYIHHEVDIAKATGWLVKPGVDPSTVRPRPLQASA